MNIKHIIAFVTINTFVQIGYKRVGEQRGDAEIY